MYRKNSSKEKLKAEQACYGILHTLAYPPLAEMIGLAGYDFVVIDGEHGPGGMREHLACLQAVSATAATAVLRVASNDEVALKRALDMGAEGVMIPDIRTADQAREAVASCLYPPRGKRGFSAATARASDYGFNVRQYITDDASELLICLMIESAEGVANAAEIAAVEGVDAIQLGPFDLSYDMGIPGQFEQPDFAEALARIESATIAAGKALGGIPLPGLPMESVLKRGYRMITVGVDVPMFSQTLAAHLQNATGFAAPGTESTQDKT